jgi:tetratricopeptide (TPR) repeat protein
VVHLQVPDVSEVIPLLRYRVPDLREDANLEVADYLAFLRGSGLTSGTQDRDAGAIDIAWRQDWKDLGADPLRFYAESRDHFLSMVDDHIDVSTQLQRAALVVALARATGARSYADWGAGSGRECIILARSGIPTTYLDVPGEGTRFAQWRFAQRNLSIEVADALAPPDKRFDLISNFDCLEHVEDPIGLLCTMVEHLNPGGHLVLMVDFYDIRLDESYNHLAKNFVYGGIMQLSLAAAGLIQNYGLMNPFLETARNDIGIWQRPNDPDWSAAEFARRLRQQVANRLQTFKGFFELELERQQAALSELDGTKQPPLPVVEHGVGGPLQASATDVSDLVAAMRANGPTSSPPPAAVNSAEEAQACESQADTLLAQGRVAEAVAAYEQALALQPQRPGVHVKLASLLRDVGRTADAIPHFRQALTEDPGNALITLRLVRTLISIQDHQGAYDELDALVRRQPDVPQYRLVLADLLVGQNELEAAAEVLGAGIDHTPDAPEIYQRLSTVLNRLGRFDESRDAFEIAAQLVSGPTAPQPAGPAPATFSFPS